MSTTIWRSKPQSQRRRIQANTPRGRCHCERCFKPLSYDYGSFRWQCYDKDLCPRCWGEEAADRIFKLAPPSRVQAVGLSKHNAFDPQREYPGTYGWEE